MAELATREQALAYLAEMSPTETYQVQPFQNGWVCTKVLSRAQMESSAGLGLAHLIIDSETGIVYVYPSWSEKMVVEAFTEFKRTGVNRAGRRIYPHQWAITIQRTSEDDRTITYQLTAESLTDPPKPTQQLPLVIDKRTLKYEPKTPLTRAAISRAEAERSQNHGVWPETATIRV